jgi:hypothetical protein
MDFATILSVAAQGASGGAPSADPMWADVLLLVTGSGADGSTTFTDESSFARPITAFGAVQMDTGVQILGGPSILFDGDGDYLTVPDSNDWVMGAFTIEAIVRTATANVGIIGPSGGTDAAFGWTLYTGDNGYIYFQYFDNTATGRDFNAFPGTQVATGAAHHVCIERNASNVMRTYYDGVIQKEATVTHTFQNGTAALHIGRKVNGPLDFSGSMAEIRITRAARYDGAFTPPTERFPR